MSELAEVLGLETASQFQYAVERAVTLLRSGEAVALPTETVYGLAANALNVEAVSRIFLIKGRPSHNPLIVHVGSLAMAMECTVEWPDNAAKLAGAFWPGPLTVVVRRSSLVPDIVTAGGDTVALRWPAHPFMRAVINLAGFPLAAPSANLSGEISPTSARHVQRSLGDKLRLIVDAGQAQVGIESTVVDCTGSIPRILRPGIISGTQIAAELKFAKASNFDPSHAMGPLRSPGLLEKHYAPKARVIIRSWKNEKDLVQAIRVAGFSPKEAHLIVHTEIPRTNVFGQISVIPLDAEAYARAIYSELHQRDEAGARLIVVEQLPDTSDWEGINDRLRRASN
jgi:L-threonylcarbamoyladenylate synthase